jgi:hypothetical protein
LGDVSIVQRFQRQNEVVHSSYSTFCFDIKKPPLFQMFGSAASGTKDTMCSPNTRQPAIVNIHSYREVSSMAFIFSFSTFCLDTKSRTKKSRRSEGMCKAPGLLTLRALLPSL